MGTDKITLELDASTIERIIESMPTDAKIKLIRKLEEETWTDRLDSIVSRIRKKIAGKSLTDKEISRICEEARQNLYNERTKSRN